MSIENPPGDGSFREDASGDLHYRLELTPAQLKVTHTALKSLLDDFGHDEHEVVAAIHEVLDKLPDEHSIRAIDLERERKAQEG